MQSVLILISLFSIAGVSQATDRGCFRVFKNPIDQYFADVPAISGTRYKDGEVFHHFPGGGSAYHLGSPTHWSSAGSMNAFGIEGVYAYNHYFSEKNQFLNYLDFLKRDGIHRLRPDQVGIAFHMQLSGKEPQVFWVFDLKKLKDPAITKTLPKAYQNILNDYLDFVEPIYKKRLEISTPLWKKLKEHTLLTADRSILILSTKESFIEIKNGELSYRHSNPLMVPDPFGIQDPALTAKIMASFDEMGWGTTSPPFTIEGVSLTPNYKSVVPMPDKLDIQGGAILVFSSKAIEKVPIELLNEKLKIKRVKGRKLGNITRFAVKEGSPNTLSGKLISDISAVAYGDPLVNSLTIEADPRHAKLYSPFGFNKTVEFKGVQSSHDQSMEVAPETLFENILKKSPYDSNGLLWPEY